MAVFFFTEQILAQLLSFDCKLVLSVYRNYFTMPNIDYINRTEFRDSLIIKGEPHSNDLTTMMRHFIRRLLTVKAGKYGLTDPSNLKAFYEFETSILAFRHIGFEKEDLMEIIQSELEGHEEGQEDMDSIYSRCV